MKFIVEQREHGGETLFVLREETTGAQAVIWPAFGNQCMELVLPGPDGTLVRLIDDLENMDKVREMPSRYGNPVLFPWPSGIPAGEYTFQGKHYKAGPLGLGGAVHHGLVRDRAFQVVRSGADENAAELVCSISTEDHPGILENYPFANRLTIKYRLERGIGVPPMSSRTVVEERRGRGGPSLAEAIEDIGETPMPRLGQRSTTKDGEDIGETPMPRVRLTALAEVENLGDAAMPFGFGFHPYFAIPFSAAGKRADCVLQCEAGKKWDFRSIASLTAGETGRNVSEFTKPNDLATPHVLGDGDYNHGLTDIPVSNDRVEARIADPAAGIAAVVSATSNFTSFVIYTPPGRSSICLEPWTCSSNVFNLAAAGVEEAGLLVLAPGERWRGRIGIYLVKI